MMPAPSQMLLIVQHLPNKRTTVRIPATGEQADQQPVSAS
jgi:hypothetical protein